MDYHAKEQKKKKKTEEQKNMSKVQNLNFHISFTPLVETLPMCMHEYCGVNAYYKRRMSFETFTPMWSHVNENEK